MRTGRLDHTSAVQDLLGLRAGPAVDVSPVVVVDDMRIGPYPTSRPWMLGGSIAGVAAQWSYLVIANVSDAGTRTRVVIDGVRWRPGIATSLMQSILKLSSLTINQPGGGAKSRDSSDLTDEPWAPGVGWAGQASNNLLGNFEVDPLGLAQPSDVPAMPVILAPQTCIVYRTVAQNCSLDFAAFGRFYDAS